MLIKRILYFFYVALISFGVTTTTGCKSEKADKESKTILDTNETKNIIDEKNNNELVPVFIPSLSAILLAAERRKGSPLTEEEVLNIRDNSTTIMSPKSMISAMAKSRGYEDIDPENAWNEWQLLRKTLNTNTSIDEKQNAVVMDNPSGDPKMEQAEQKARASLDKFRHLITKYPETPSLIKVYIEDTHTNSRMWLFVDKVEATGFKAHLFEVPSDFEKYQVGDSFHINDDKILDWMINNHGDVYGAFTIQVQREGMSLEKRTEMDEYMGIKKYIN